MIKPEGKAYLQLAPYYLKMLDKIGFDAYKFITYFPEKIETVSGDLSVKSDYYQIFGKLKVLDTNSKFVKFSIETDTGEIRLYDFSKKIKFMITKGAVSEGKNIRCLIKQSGGDYYTLVEVRYQNSIYPALIPKYKNISFKIRNKQILQLHFELSNSQYELDLSGLLPKNSFELFGVGQKLSLEQIHKPTSLISYNETLYQWFKLQAFLDIAYFNSLSNLNELKKEEPISSSLKIGLTLMEEFDKIKSFELSKSQNDTIEKVIHKICD
jgi:hypothetical protein